jgi:hypothetical protein
LNADGTKLVGRAVVVTDHVGSSNSNRGKNC